METFLGSCAQGIEIEFKSQEMEENILIQQKFWLPNISKTVMLVLKVFSFEMQKPSLCKYINWFYQNKKFKLCIKNQHVFVNENLHMKETRTNLKQKSSVKDLHQIIWIGSEISISWQEQTFVHKSMNFSGNRTIYVSSDKMYFVIAFNKCLKLAIWPTEKA